MDENIIRTETYSGPERRQQLEVVVKKCLCHVAHSKTLESHEESLKNNKSDHKVIWDDVKQKVPNKLFYLFVGIVVGGLAFVYHGIYGVDKNIAIVETKMEAKFQSVESEITSLRKEIDRHDSYQYRFNWKTPKWDYKKEEE